MILGDTHYGVRKNNIHFYNYQRKFVEGHILPICEKIKPAAIVHLGDLVDDRNSINYRTYDHLENDYLNLMRQVNIPQYWIVGNHDSYYKNSLKINAVEKFVKHGEIISSPKIINVNGESITFLPWICDENREESFSLTHKNPTKFCFGHLEINGFEVRRGTVHKNGYAKDLFQNYHSVISGHFHNRSMHDNITYIGSCYEFDWSDYGEYKGIALLDTETSKIKYYKNPYNMFNVFEYDESNIPEIKNIEGSYVRVLVKNKTSESKFNDFISTIEDNDVIKCDIIESDIKKFEMIEDTNFPVDDLREMCQTVIDSLELSNSADVKELFNKIYDRSI